MYGRYLFTISRLKSCICTHVRARRAASTCLNLFGRRHSGMSTHVGPGTGEHNSVYCTRAHPMQRARNHEKSRLCERILRCARQHVRPMSACLCVSARAGAQETFTL